MVAATGVELGRASHRRRDPASAPPEWARAEVEASAGRKASEVRPLVFDLGDRLGLMRPLPVQGLCTTCHGDPARFPAGLAEALRAAYPDDRAVGFAEGDLRGGLWAEVRR